MFSMKIWIFALFFNYYKDLDGKIDHMLYYIFNVLFNSILVFSLV